jgi:hypothetical protein
VHVLKSQNQASHHEASFLLTETLALADVEAEVTSGQQVTAKVKCLAVLESIADVNEESTVVKYLVITGAGAWRATCVRS